MSLRPKEPFTSSFSCPQGTDSITIDIINTRYVSDFFCYVEDDNKGPVYINAYLVMANTKFPLVNGSIYDGAGPNRKILKCDRDYPIDRALGAEVTIEYSNYSGQDITLVKFGWIAHR